jgi:hypothetical protein
MLGDRLVAFTRGAHLLGLKQFLRRIVSAGGWVGGAAEA